MSKRGLTLVELLVSAALLLLITALVGTALVAYLRAYRTLQPGEPSQRALAYGLEHLSRDLRSATALYAPDDRRLESAYAPVLGTSEPLLVALPRPGGARLAAFMYDPSQRAVCRIELSQNWKPGQPLAGTRVTLARARGFEVQLFREGRARLLRVSLQGAPRKLPLETRVRFRPMFVSELAP